MHGYSKLLDESASRFLAFSFPVTHLDGNWKVCVSGFLSKLDLCRINAFIKLCVWGEGGGRV